MLPGFYRLLPQLVGDPGGVWGCLGDGDAAGIRLPILFSSQLHLQNALPINLIGERWPRPGKEKPRAVRCSGVQGVASALRLFR